MFEFDLNVTGDGGDTIGEEFFADVAGGKITGEYFGLSSKVCPAVKYSKRSLQSEKYDIFRSEAHRRKIKMLT